MQQHLRRVFAVFVVSSFFVGGVDAQESPMNPSAGGDPSTCDAQPTARFAACRVDTTRRSALTSQDGALLPASGFVLWSGGFMSSVGVYAFDAAAERLSFFRSRTLDRPLQRKDLRRVITLTEAELEGLIAASNRVWSSHERFINNPPNADQNVRLVLAAGDDIKDISSYGPAQGALDDLFSRVLGIVNTRALEAGQHEP